MVPKRFLLLLVVIGVISSLPLTVKRLIKPKTTEDFFQLRSPGKSLPAVDGIEIEWSTNDKRRMVDFDSPITRKFVEEFPSSKMMVGGKKNEDPGTDSFPLLSGMEPLRWKEILDPEQYKQLVTEMRVPVKTFDERRYNTLIRELDLYRTQNYWETTRPHLEKKLEACSTDAEREILQEKIDEFHALSYERILYYQKLPARAQQKDYSKYYDPRVKGSEELRHIPPFSLIQHAVADFVEKHGQPQPVDNGNGQGRADRHYYEDYVEVPETSENDYSDPEDATYLPSLNEEESDRKTLIQEHSKQETKALMNNVLVKDVTDRSIFYQMMPEQFRQAYDFLLYVRKRPTKGEFSSAATVAGIIFGFSLMQLQSARSPYYITLGHLSLLSMLLSRGRPKENSRMAAMMSQFRPTVTWSPSAFRLGLLLTTAAAIPFTALFFALFMALPVPLSWGLKLGAAYAFSLIPNLFWTTQFQIYESKKEDGQVWRSFKENIKSAKDRQSSSQQKRSTDALTLRLGESMSDYMERSGNQLPLYQEYTDDMNPEDVLSPRLRYADQYDDEIKKTVKDYEPRLYQSDDLTTDESTRRSAVQHAKQIRNVQKEVDQYDGTVKRFFQIRAEKNQRNRVSEHYATDDIEKIMGVKPGFLISNENDQKNWVSNLQDRKINYLEKKISKFTPSSLKKAPKFMKTKKGKYEKDENPVYIGEFGFRDYRPQWLINLFGRDDLDRVQPIQEDFLKKFARKFGFYRLSHHKKDADIVLSAAEMNK